MTSQQVAEKKEKSAGEMLIVTVLIALLMTSFIFYFFKHQGQLTRVGFENMSNTFSARINVIHAQWFMDGQPKLVSINTGTEQQADKNIVVPVNKSGWVAAENSALACQKIWQFVMEIPLAYMKQPVAAIFIEDNKKSSVQYCQYSLPSGEFFTYHSSNGKVSKVGTLLK